MMRISYSFLSKTKDKVPAGNQCGVYRVNCTCGRAYIGQTCRPIKVRLQEHQRATRNQQLRLSAIAEHTWSGPNHNPDYDNAKVIANEKRYFPRIIREAIEIMKTPNNLNREDGYQLSNTWRRVLKSIPGETGQSQEVRTNEKPPGPPEPANEKTPASDEVYKRRAIPRISTSLT